MSLFRVKNVATGSASVVDTGNSNSPGDAALKFAQDNDLASGVRLIVTPIGEVRVFVVSTTPVVGGAVPTLPADIEQL